MLNKQTILITGGSGSWGNELVKSILNKYSPKEIRIFSRGELKQVEMKRKFHDPRIKYIIGDVRDKDKMLLATNGVDTIFHLAALKHVPVCEENPEEAVHTNIIGTENVIYSALENGVKKVVDISTDKAVDPFNLYGVTKACGEKLVIAANLHNSTQFVCIRGGNVIGTNGSVVPLFVEQIDKTNEVTITDPRMTRFFMSLEEAIGLVLKATAETVGGEIFVMKMPGCKITDLAEVMIKRLGNSHTRIREIGIRPGEKLFEVLVSRYEVPRTYDLGKYFVILPQINLPKINDFYLQKKLNNIPESFDSNNAIQLNPEEIEQMLVSDGWFDKTKEKEALNYLRNLDKDGLSNFFLAEGWIPNRQV